MSYLRGCLVMLAVLAGCYYFEMRQLERLALPYTKWLALGLAVIVALLAGSVDELIAMHFRRGQIAALVENERIEISGRLRPLGDLVGSPVSGRRVLMFEYLWDELLFSTGERQQASGMIRGIAMAPCELLTPKGALRIEGFANLEHFEEATLDSAEAMPRMEEFLKRKEWKAVSGGNIVESIKLLDAPMGIEGGSQHLLNAAAVAKVENGGLTKFRWRLTETVVVPGVEVTVKGEYRSNPPRIQVGREGLQVSNEMRPGSAAVVAGENLTRQWIGVGVFIAIAALSHLFVYKWLSSILQMSSE